MGSGLSKEQGSTHIQGFGKGRGMKAPRRQKFGSRIKLLRLSDPGKLTLSPPALALTGMVGGQQLTPSPPALALTGMVGG